MATGAIGRRRGTEHVLPNNSMEEELRSLLAPWLNHSYKSSPSGPGFIVSDISSHEEHAEWLGWLCCHTDFKACPDSALELLQLYPIPKQGGFWCIAFAYICFDAFNTDLITSFECTLELLQLYPIPKQGGFWCIAFAYICFDAFK
ncbi:hypothetical protein ONE63_003789 [Megalurothrips usitatus]|uniref:Uncharacterized protein n=1 Tax=Megalurothrips usitatus TaxID=439358 RepID=A0AAV7X8C4_9NEOP|nr:hypothetical protein ONE63_003789 [Megalurothrips usitatus]